MMKQLVDFAGLKIKLASPGDIKDWSKGEVTKPETINYRTLRPEKDGLFCERIFGPTKDWECYCGKYKRIRYRGIVCDKCGVEVTQSRVRRERMGHITLASPVAHIWFFKGIPSRLSLLLDLPQKDVEAVIYFAQYLVTEVDHKERKKTLANLEKELEERKKGLKTELEAKIKKNEEEAEKQQKEAEKTVKEREQQLLAKEEIKLRSRQSIQSLRDEYVLEEEKIEDTYRRTLELVRTLKSPSVLSEDEYLLLSYSKASSFLKVGMGAEILLEVIKRIKLDQLAADLRKQMKETRGANYVKVSKRLRLVEGMMKAGVSPEWMIVQILPVIPADLRPMVQLSGGRFATSDLNDLYRRVINRNNRLKHLIDLGAPEIILRNEKRMLQEAVDSLIDASKSLTRQTRNRRTQPYRSLSDMLRGKQGRFRQNLLGKRVDYSGRSVIVVGPELKLSQCGLPKEMAIEMFKPFLLRELILSGMAPNVKTAKYILEKQPPEVYDILEKITQNHPVLLNRAPTLHKLGIQAFWPVLIEGSAISIPPSICAGFNADFDGDQMAVHLPLGEKAQEESINFMMSEKNLLKPADGSPVTLPNKEMALGCYFITSVDPKIGISSVTFAGEEEAVLAYQGGKIGLRQLIKMRREGSIIETTVGRLVFNQRLPEEIGFINDGVKEQTLRSLVTRAMRVCALEKVAKLIDDLKELGFWGSTISGLSVGIWDCRIYPQKGKIIEESNQEVARIEENFSQGLITAQEKKRLVQEVWIDTTEKLAEATWNEFKPDDSIRIMVDAGLRRVSKEQVKQLSAMRGLVVDPLGKIVELPTKSNFREGLSVFEYVTSARGSRKALIDIALKTADAGYLTRRLVDVAHDMIIREEDCGTTQGIKIVRAGKRAEKFPLRVLGRIVLKPVMAPKTKKVLIKEGELINEDSLELLEKHQVQEVWVRSPLTCESKYGLCAQCYGWDFSSRKMVNVGTPGGVIAAQSIGEPGTQLTLRAKHFGGIIISDVTQGLPRVEELFEVRTPKGLSPLAEISGKVSLEETEEGHKVKIKSVGVKPIEEREYIIPSVSKVLVEDGQLIEAGGQLASGSLDVKEILGIRGLRAAQEYLIEEIQAVYESQGIPINDKHFEVIVRKMSDKVRIETPGDSSFLPGELIERFTFEEENERLLAEGGEPPIARVIILGVTPAALYTSSWLSAASFQETTNVLAEASLEGREDRLIGLKENVIIGRLIPVTPERVKIEE
jgi:DNA-directed RNA polymerase subunit beta'